MRENETGSEKNAAVRLFAMQTTAEATARTEGYRFNRITAFYILIYTDKGQPEGSVEITEKEAGRLTAADRRWLEECQAALIVEHIEAEKPNLLRKMNDFLAVAEALEKERRGGEADGRENE